MGKDYVWGADGPYNFDCSGFTKFVYSQNGIKLPRVSKEQAQIGQFVSRNNLRRGDLVFFSTSRHSEVGHAGIYLGRGEFIHASSAKDRVVISSIYSNYYSKHFKWGRRVVR
jgi:cell wall-associated NlpC family hydrolase